MENDLSREIVLLVSTLVSSLIGLAVQLYRESRARRWAVEDRDYAHRLGAKIDENTQITQNLEAPVHETQSLLSRMAAIPTVPVAPIRAEDASDILARREHRAGPPGRRKDDPR